VALAEDGQYLAGVSQDGRVGVWDLGANGAQIRDHETKGSFGTCIDLVGPRRTPITLSANISSRPMADSLPVDMKMVPSTSSALKQAACHSLCPVRGATSPETSTGPNKICRPSEASSIGGFLTRREDSGSSWRLQGDCAV